jgi:hypothetical protein
MRKNILMAAVAIAALSLATSAGAAELRLYGGGHFQQKHRHRRNLHARQHRRRRHGAATQSRREDGRYRHDG